jgi:hypothetical protein
MSNTKAARSGARSVLGHAGMPPSSLAAICSGRSPHSRIRSSREWPATPSRPLRLVRCCWPSRTTGRTRQAACRQAFEQTAFAVRRFCSGLSTEYPWTNACPEGKSWLRFAAREACSRNDGSYSAGVRTGGRQRPVVKQGLDIARGCVVGDGRVSRPGWVSNRHDPRRWGSCRLSKPMTSPETVLPWSARDGWRYPGPLGRSGLACRRRLSSHSAVIDMAAPLAKV